MTVGPRYEVRIEKVAPERPGAHDGILDNGRFGFRFVDGSRSVERHGEAIRVGHRDHDVDQGRRHAAIGQAHDLGGVEHERARLNRNPHFYGARGDTRCRFFDIRGPDRLGCPQAHRQHGLVIQHRRILDAVFVEPFGVDRTVLLQPGDGFSPDLDRAYVHPPVRCDECHHARIRARLVRASDPGSGKDAPAVQRELDRPETRAAFGLNRLLPAIRQKALSGCRFAVNDGGYFDARPVRFETQDGIRDSRVGGYPASKERLPPVDLLSVERTRESRGHHGDDSKNFHACSKFFHHFYIFLISR